MSLTGLRAVVGQLERANSAARLHPLSAEAVVLAALDWPLPGGGRLSVTSPASLADLTIELDAAATPDATPMTGRVSAGRAEADAIAIDLPGGARLAFDADLHGAEVAHSPERVGHAAADKVELANLQAVLGGALCRLSSAVLERARVDWRGGELLIGAAAGSAGGVTISVPGSGLTIEIDRIELPGGLRTSGGALVVPELVVPELRIAVDDLVGLFRRGDGAPTRESRPFDYGFLDRVSGRLDVDMTLDISMPVLGRREATHHFRVPIAGGVINYRELERDLANFEDAFIDVEVRGQALVIERAIPLIPGLEKPLVMWDLDREELELARRRLVRLRTIPRLRMASRGGDRSEKSSLSVRSLRFDDVDIAISLAPPAPGEKDSIGRASAGSLRVTGRLAHEPHRTAEGAEVTRANASGSKLAAGPIELGLARSARGGSAPRVELESIEVGALVDGTATFSGLRPQKASLIARDVVVRNLRVLLGS
ncbi:MAG TPA: hypothetical protein VNO33_17740 [Kofleriaceae bacterium]|nr:hypothetical protein [Kofleriaceae bacterium]